MNNTKRRAIMFVVSGATIGVVAVGVYFLQDDRTPPTTDIPSTATSTISIFDTEPIIPEAKVSTEGWKTCRNEEYGYEFQFPGEWYVFGEDSERLPYTRGYVSPSGNCVGVVVAIEESVDLGEREQKNIYVKVRDDFIYSQTNTLQVEKNTDNSLLENFKEVLISQNRPFGTTVIDGQIALYEKSASNSLKGGYILTMFLEHPQRGVIMLSFSNLDIDIIETILSTVYFSTSTGELNWNMYYE